MGWLYGWNSRKELAEHLLRGNGVVTIKNAWKGNNLWAVQEYQNKGDARLTRFVALYLCRGRADSRDGWGYKDIDESMGPSETSCPLSFIEMVEEHEKANGYEPVGYAAEWRDRVREIHAKGKRTLEVGQQFKLYGRDYSVTAKLERGFYRVINSVGDLFRMKPSQVKDVVLP